MKLMQPELGYPSPLPTHPRLLPPLHSLSKAKKVPSDLSTWA